MARKLFLVLAACLLAPQLGAAQEAKAVLDGVAKAMGDVKSLQYAGSGAFFSFGQSFSPGDPWPRFGLKSYTRTVNYETPALRDEVVRAEGDPVARGGGLPTLDLTITEVKANPPADIQPPENVRQATIKVQADKVADDVWYLTGGTHHSVLVEMSDHLVVIEGPQDDARANALIAEVKRLVPNKPIKYVVNSHHHFDHAGGLAAFAAEGATIITHDSTKAFLEQSLAAPQTIQPDKLARSGKKAIVEGMQDKRVLSDGTRTVELYRIQGNTHSDGLIMAYLPKEKLLVEADLYTPPPPNTAPPAQPNPASVNLYDNIERLKLAVDQILPLHGRKVPLAELQKWIGKAS